jgi:hypothetical protein
VHGDRAIDLAGRSAVGVAAFQECRGTLSPCTPCKARETTRKGNVKSENRPVHPSTQPSQFTTLFPILAVQDVRTTAPFLGARAVPKSALASVRSFVLNLGAGDDRNHRYPQRAGHESQTFTHGLQPPFAPLRTGRLRSASWATYEPEMQSRAPVLSVRCRDLRLTPAISRNIRAPPFDCPQLPRRELRRRGHGSGCDRV